MAHESFEDATVAEWLNRDYISIKVDREERPDIDGVYMRACQAMTGGGGWPTSIFMTPDGKPFYAGTYFPKPGFLRLLKLIAYEWGHNRETLLEQGDRLTEAVSAIREEGTREDGSSEPPIEAAVKAFRTQFDAQCGGFGDAPKFPSPQNLMLLLYTAPSLAETTLLNMYRGGIFDHIGGGFSRYATDRRWLIPHFEKMLYDNALLSMAYLMAHEATGNSLYRHIAEHTLEYLEREMHAPDGGFYSAQDADSDGEEGAYYVFTPDEVNTLLGEQDGKRFCAHYGISRGGNFEGKNIPNLLHAPKPDAQIEAMLPKVYAYRKQRMALGMDKKQLTAWNALAAAAFAMAGRVLKEDHYLSVARETLDFLHRNVVQNGRVHVGLTDGKRSGPGFLDDYAYYAFALLQMHQAAQEPADLARAAALADHAWEMFWDDQGGGFFFSGSGNESLIARPKESWDGAMPSGNSMMAYVLNRLELLTNDQKFEERASSQRRYMNGEASKYPMGYGFYLYACLPVKKIVCAPKSTNDIRRLSIHSNWAFSITDSPEYPLINDQTTYYVCTNNTCLPPTNAL